MSETSACSVTGCDQPTVALLETRALCREHFVAACYDRIDECGDRLTDRPYPAESTVAMWQFVTGASQQLVAMTQQASHLDNLERARLLDLLLCVADLSQRLRRSPRKTAVIPVLVRCQEPGRAWEEVGMTLPEPLRRSYRMPKSDTDQRWTSSCTNRYREKSAGPGCVVQSRKRRHPGSRT